MGHPRRFQTAPPPRSAGKNDDAADALALRDVGESAVVRDKRLAESDHAANQFELAGLTREHRDASTRRRYAAGEIGELGSFLNRADDHHVASATVPGKQNRCEAFEGLGFPRHDGSSAREAQQICSWNEAARFEPTRGPRPHIVGQRERPLIRRAFSERRVSPRLLDRSGTQRRHLRPRARQGEVHFARKGTACVIGLVRQPHASVQRTRQKPREARRA